MHAKILIWIGVGVIALTIIILLIWVGLAGFLPRISIQIDWPEVNLPPPGQLVQQGLELLREAIAVPLDMLASFFQVSSQQIIEAFTSPPR
jgi:hypothetical protein